MNKLAVFAVALPMAVMGGWLARLVWLDHSGTEVRLPVTGFDPRDLLAGHYLTYTVDYGSAGVCPQAVDNEVFETCICLAADTATKTHAATWSGACDSRPTACSLFIKGDCEYGRFTANIERFYFPETFQTALAVVPEKSVISVKVTPTGDGLVTGFAVDGVNVLDYVQQ
jgi:uncharacterized membrane-anchored protein